MRAAQSLLSDTNIPVSLIATKVGYSNFSYFRRFLRNTRACRRWSTVRQSGGLSCKARFLSVNCCKTVTKCKIRVNG